MADSPQVSSQGRSFPSDGRHETGCRLLDFRSCQNTGRCSLTSVHSQNITPASQPFACASETHLASVDALMYLLESAPAFSSHSSTHPLYAAPESSGLPMTILSSGTPAYELISITEVDGQSSPELWIKLYSMSAENGAQRRDLPRN